MIAPKNRQSVNEKYTFSELNIEMTAYMKPLEMKQLKFVTHHRCKNLNQTYPMKKQENAVPMNASVNMAPKFLKKCLLTKMQNKFCNFETILFHFDFKTLLSSYCSRRGI